MRLVAVVLVDNRTVYINPARIESVCIHNGGVRIFCPGDIEGWCLHPDLKLPQVVGLINEAMGETVQ